MTHGRHKKRRRMQSLMRMPKIPVPQQPTFDSKELVCFLTYSVGCIALQKLVSELADYWKQDNIKYAVFDQTTFENTLKDYIWKVVVLHRGATHGWNPQKTQQFMTLLKHQKNNGARLVYYMDDFLMHMNNNTPLHIMEMCDTVIAKGYFLPNYLANSEGVKNVVPLKTWINLKKFDADTPQVDFKYPKNILWFSAGRTGLGFMPSVFEAMNPEDWKDTEWLIVGSTVAVYRARLNKYRGFNKGYSEKIDIDNLYSLIKASDIIINPLHPDIDNAELVQMPAHKIFFNNAKVEIKYILAGAGRKPLLTCHSRAYEECIRHGENGFITDDPKEWADILLKLKNDEILRKTVGDAARKQIEEEYEAGLRWNTIKDYILGK